MTSPVPDALRTELAEEATRHHMVIGVDQRLVMCRCGWSSTDEANLRRPVAPFGAHVAEALLPFFARARAEGAAEALLRAANSVESLGIQAKTRTELACRPGLFNASDVLRNKAAALSAPTTTEGDPT